MIDQLMAGSNLADLLRALRVLVSVTGMLVMIDSLGICLRRDETPPHKPMWSAAAWLIGGGTVAIANMFLLSRGSTFVGPGAEPVEQLATVLLYLGLASAFTVRAISRARRPWLIVSSAAGMAAYGVFLTTAGWA
jgi:hypothetical protein